MLGLASTDATGASATKWARCPVCYEALHVHPQEVGALIFEGKRVESALYHKSCLMDVHGRLRMSASLTPPWYRSPISRQAVDDFILIPPTSKPIAWTKFVDWNADGRVDISELAIAVAAILPVDEREAEQLVSSRFDKDGNGVLDAAEIRKHVLPFIRSRTASMVARSKRAPEIFSSSSYQAFYEWFDFYDKESNGWLMQPCLRAAISSCYRSVAPHLRSKLAQIVLDEANFFPDECVSRAAFQSKVVPILKANLPDESEPEFGRGVVLQSRPYDPKQPLSVHLVSSRGLKKCAIVSPAATVGDLRFETRRLYRVWLGSKDAELCVGGRFLSDDSASLLSLPFYVGEAVVQVLPKARVEVPRRGGDNSHASDDDSECSECFSLSDSSNESDVF